MQQRGVEGEEGGWLAHSEEGVMNLIGKCVSQCVPEMGNHFRGSMENLQVPQIVARTHTLGSHFYGTTRLRQVLNYM